MRNLIICSLLLFLLTLAHSSNKTNEATFALIKELYNGSIISQIQQIGHFSQLYMLFSPAVQMNNPQLNFTTYLSQLYASAGKIQYETYMGEANGVVTYSVAYEKTLQASFFIWSYNENFLSSLIIPPPPALSVVEFLRRNPSKGALTIFNNERKVVTFNENRDQPLCSVLKIPIVLEYAKQVSQNKISQQTLIPISELLLYYVPNLDTMFSVFLKWANQKNLIINNSLSLNTIIQGMIIFSVNANTEFLEQYLGLGNIEKTIVESKIQQTRIIYLVSSLLAMSNYKNLTKADYMNTLYGMNESIFYQSQQEIHEILMTGNSTAKYLLNNAQYSLLQPEVMAISANWLVNSTSYEYANLMKKINYGDILTPEANQIAQTILGSAIFSGPNGQYLYQHAGIKGGSANVIGIKNAILATAAFSKVNYPKNDVPFFSICLLTRGINNDQFSSLYNQLNAFFSLAMTNAEFNLDIEKRLHNNLRH